MKKYIITIVVIIGIMFVLFGSMYIYSSNHSQDDNVDGLKSKADEEIKYLSSTIVSMMNKFNNITYANYKIFEEEVSSEENQNSQSSTTEQGNSSGGNSSSGNRGESQSNSKSTTNINMEYSSVFNLWT